ncbi:CoxG family protein [Aquincola sp. J276]|uniref:CoxG family protein n=1 Tax=Aquincola sp. J276 TaxID=2898432 RepID=UPI0021518733|nr:carbon monoxide dehydrogenase subunit G [Aquincola sp. J276]MCR5865980.1 carbon monoxide dehydrogenase subunit G [Aquincola sp. J276]
MQLTNQQTLPVSQVQAWEALNDISLLQAAMPGCESITPTGENQYEVLVTAAIGPVKAKFKGKLKLADLDPPNAYNIQFEGQGGAAGHAKGTAAVRLEPAGPHSTVLHYTANANVGGKIAQIGSRLVDMAAQKMATEFFETFNAKLAERYAPAPEPAAAVAEPAAAAAPVKKGGFWAWLKRLFGG